MVAASSITGLTLTGGNGVTGGGLHLSEAGALEVADSVISGNTAQEGGGAWFAAGAVVTLTSTTIDDNVAEHGGGVFAGEDSSLDLTTSTISGNEASHSGGGIYLESGEVFGGLISANTVPGPDCASGGGGLFVDSDSRVTGTVISSNGTNCDGGGIRAYSIGPGNLLVLIDVEVYGNTSERLYGMGRGGIGGGINAAQFDVELVGTTSVTGNSGQFGGGVGMSGGSLIGGELTLNDSTVGGGVSVFMGEVRSVVVTSNSATNGGGGVYLGPEASMVDSTVEWNTASSGGGVFLEHYDYYGYYSQLLSIDSTLVANNTATSAGGGLYMNVADATVELTDVTVLDNAAVDGAGAWLNGTAEVTGGVWLRNLATGVGGGIFLDEPASLQCSLCDFGSSVDDNAPDDMASAALDVLGYESGETFLCSHTSCTPLP